MQVDIIHDTILPVIQNIIEMSARPVRPTLRPARRIYAFGFRPLWMAATPPVRFS